MHAARYAASVAGVYTPAFVERRSTSRATASISKSVAGVYTPAFVERRSRLVPIRRLTASVAGVYTPAFVERCTSVLCEPRARLCRRSLYSGLR